MNEDCPHCVFEKTEANCRGCFEGSHYKPKQITNADRIRSMTDERYMKYLEECVERFKAEEAKGEYDWLKEKKEKKHELGMDTHILCD